MEWKTTTNHDEIRQWIKKHNGFPAIISGTTTDRGRAVIEIAFPGYTYDIEQISWEEFFDNFDTRKLAMRYRLNDRREPDWNFISREKNVTEPENKTTLLEDREEYTNNVFPSSRFNN